MKDDLFKDDLFEVVFRICASLERIASTLEVIARASIVSAGPASAGRLEIIAKQPE